MQKTPSTGSVIIPHPTHAPSQLVCLHYMCLVIHTYVLYAYTPTRAPMYVVLALLFRLHVPIHSDAAGPTVVWSGPRGPGERSPAGPEEGRPHPHCRHTAQQVQSRQVRQEEWSLPGRPGSVTLVSLSLSSLSLSRALTVSAVAHTHTHKQTNSLSLSLNAAGNRAGSYCVPLLPDLRYNGHL